MNTDSISFALNSVASLVNSSLNKTQYKLQLTELEKCITKFGFELEKNLYKSVISLLLSTSNSNEVSLLQQLYFDLGSPFLKSNFRSILCYSLNDFTELCPGRSSNTSEKRKGAVLEGNSAHEANKDIVGKLHELVRLLRLSESEKLALFVTFNELSVCERDIDFLKCQFSPSSELTCGVISQLNSSADSKAKELLKRVLKGFPSLPSSAEIADPELVPLPYLESPIMDGHLPSNASILSDDQITGLLVNESGVQLSSDLIRQYNINVTPKLCAKLLFAICDLARHDTLGVQPQRAQDDVDTLANICREFLPSASPLHDILQAIDDDAFISNNSKIISFENGVTKSFQKFWHFCINLCNTDKQGIAILGIVFFGKPWSRNAEFQFGFIWTCVKNQLVSKLLSVSQTGSGITQELGQLVEVENLKCQPDIAADPEISTWKYQKLYQVLVDLCNHGSNGQLFTKPVLELVIWPAAHCPDLLTLGVLGCHSGQTQIKAEILNLTIPAFLSNNANAAVILHTIWSISEPLPSGPSVNHWVRQVLLQSMSDYFTSATSDEQQQQRLSRILDVAQDLKALSSLLNSTNYPFVIDLACLASRREYLKLDKWLMDKIQSNGEQFIIASVQFLRKKCPALLVGAKVLDGSIPISNLPSETLATMLHCLNQYIANSASGSCPVISKDLSETILTMVANSAMLVQKVPRQPPPGVVSNSQQKQMPSSVQSLDSGIGSLSLSTGANLAITRPAYGSGLTGNTGAGQSFGNLQQNQPGQQERLNKAMSDLHNIFPDMKHNVSPEIEKEADTYFQRIYNQSSIGNMSIDDVLEMLRRFQDSQNQREKDIFTCMIRNLFKEYCYFPQYPDKELLITAQLFGGIIQMGLVKYMALVVALRYVLEALRKPFESKMYYFGIAALDRFKTKLKDYPLYCQHLASIAHFSDFPAHLIDYIEYGSQSLEPPNRPQNGPQQRQPRPVNPQFPVSSAAPVHVPMVPPKPSVQLPVVTGSRPSIANATNITTLTEAQTAAVTFPEPPEHIQDKIAFIVNNLSMVNLKQKTEEFKEVMGREDIYDGWIAQYFVMKRASIELNFHTLYANFLDVLNNQEINEITVRETFRNIKVLLQSDKGIGNFSDRSLLKNLGHWLGMLTLAKNKPILALELNIKNLLVEAYHKGTQELIYIVPFIAKILESCAKSRVFKPPNPWTMAILKTLVELHEVPNLKLNLKFEVEVLCKALSIEFQELVAKSECFQDEVLRLRVLGEPQLGSGRQVMIAPAQVNAFSTAPAPAVGSFGSDTRGFSEYPSGQPSPGSQFPGAQTIPSQGTHTFNYHDLQTNSLAGLAAHIHIPGNLPLWQIQPNLKQLVKPAIERAVTEWLQPVVERSIKIAIPTAEQIIKKDFALESDETKMLTAAHYLIRNLTAGMAMITSKETLFVTIAAALSSIFSRNCPTIPKEQIDTAANAIASDNIDLATCFIQKSAVDKAVPELDKRLASEYEIRRKARAEGRRYCDPSALTYQAERMPEPIRLRVGAVTSQQFSIYEDIGRNIPGFNPIVDPPSSSGFVGNTAVSLAQPVAGMFPKPVSSVPSAAPPVSGFGEPNAAQESGLVNLYDKLVAELQQLWQMFVQNNQPGLLIQTMQSILDTVLNNRENPRDIVGALNLIGRILEALNELFMSMENGLVEVVLVTRARDLYLVILKALADPRAFGHQWTTKQITRLVLERLLNQNTTTTPLPDDLFDILMRSGLINLPLMDHNLAQLIETSQNPLTLAFTLQFVKIYGHAGLHESEMQNIIASLIKLSKSVGVTNPLTLEIQQALEVFRGPIPAEATQVPFMPNHSSRTVDFDQNDPPEFMEKTERLLREWIQLYHSTTNLSKVFQVYLQQMTVHGILKTDDSISRFFRLSTELCVEFCYKVLNANPSQNSQSLIETRTKCFQTLDAFAHLIVMLVKQSGSNTAITTESTAKLNLLNKALNIIASVAMQDQEGRQENFQHLPYYRILIILFMELTLGPNNLGLPANAMQMGFGSAQLDPIYETTQFQVLNSFCIVLRVMRPGKAPSFAYAWLDFISHRTFMEKCLNSGGTSAAGGMTKGWTLYAQLIVEMVKFLSPFLRSVELSSAVDLLYKGTLKVLLVLLHDFPEFLCEFCYEFCDVIPCNAIQMRNLVLSAFPRNMRLPDPFTPNLKIDSLPEIIQTPKGTNSALSALANVPFKKELESYLRTRSPVTFLSELRGYLQQPGPNQQLDSTRYNIPLMNALVLYVGQQAIQTITPKHINMTTIAHSSQMDIFQNLAVDLDTEGRYLFLNAIANQLRYPNSNTHYFSCALLYLFAESNTEAIQEQITRVLLERLIVNRPHPWGLLVTFIELIKNQSYNFWNHEFVRCAPEIERLFESVAKSCMQNQPKQLPPNPSAEAIGSTHKQSVN